MGENEPIYIGQVVKKLRLSRGLSQQELAEYASLSERSITAIEGNHQEPKLSTLYALATALDLDFLDFMKKVDDHFKNHG